VGGPPILGAVKSRALLLCTVVLLAGCTDELVSRVDPNAAPQSDEACVPEGTPCYVELVYPLWGANKVELRGDFAPDGWDVGVPMQIDGARWRAKVAVPDGTRFRYKFLLDGTDWVVDPFNPEKEPDGVGGENSVATASCNYEICPTEMPPPPAGAFDWRSAVMYFVFVDRFRNGDGGNDAAVSGVELPANYHGGDWAGVVAKIEDGYFQELGVNCLWLTVPMDNPNTPGQGSDGHQHTGYHGYWPSDLDQVEEHFGSEADLVALVDAAHARGIKVLLDYAMNHVHAANPLVTQHPEWFWPLDYEGGSCTCGSPVCDWNDPYEQKRCWFTDYLPDWNFTNAGARQYSIDNAIDWIGRTGIDGFRLDAVKHIEIEWLTELRQRLVEEIEPQTEEHFYTVGETFESGNRDVIKYYVGPDRLTGQFDFPLRAVLAEVLLRRTGTMYDLDAFLATNDTYYPGIMSTFIGNHDILRVVHVALDQPWGAWDKGDPWGAPPPQPSDASPYERLQVAFAFLFTTKGIPLVYYGDEVGLAGAGDPDNRRPMPWEDEGATLNDHQLGLRERIGALGAVRRDHPALWRGTRSTVWVTSDTYAYRMSDGETGDTVWVALNRADVSGSVDGMPQKGRDLLTGAKIDGPMVSLPPRSALVVVPE
jgi:glycosidase